MFTPAWNGDILCQITSKWLSIGFAKHNVFVISTSQSRHAFRKGWNFSLFRITAHIKVFPKLAFELGDLYSVVPRCFFLPVGKKLLLSHSCVPGHLTCSYIFYTTPLTLGKPPWVSSNWFKQQVILDISRSFVLRKDSWKCTVKHFILFSLINPWWNIWWNSFNVFLLSPCLMYL